MPRPRAVRRASSSVAPVSMTTCALASARSGSALRSAQESQSVHRRHPHVAQHRAGSVAGAEQCHRAVPSDASRTSEKPIPSILPRVPRMKGSSSTSQGNAIKMFTSWLAGGGYEIDSKSFAFSKLTNCGLRSAVGGLPIRSRRTHSRDGSAQRTLFLARIGASGIRRQQICQNPAKRDCPSQFCQRFDCAALGRQQC